MRNAKIRKHKDGKYTQIQYRGNFEGVNILEIAKLQVCGTSVEILMSRPIPAGLVGGYVTVLYADPLWENLTKTVVFRSVVTKDVVSSDRVIPIPHEVVEQDGKHLMVGIYGTWEDGSLVIPTLWADLGLIVESVDPSGDHSTEASLPVWAQLVDHVENLKNQHAVLYTNQELTQEQQAQARMNIGAVSRELFQITEGTVVYKQINLLEDLSIFTEGKYCNVNNGGIEEWPTYCCTEEFIPFSAEDRLYTHFTINNGNFAYPHIVYYDANYRYIGGEFGSSLEQSEYEGNTVAFYNVPENTSYIRIDITKNLITEELYKNTFLYRVTDTIKNRSVEIPGLILPKGNLEGKTIVNFGDSIFGMRRPPEDISTALAELTGARVYNCGFGGCHMSKHPASTYNPFCMCNLADAVVSGDWTTQDEAVAVTGDGAVPSYFATALDILKGLNFANVDIITIAYGTNDFTGSDALDDPEDALSKDTYAGALRYSIETLLAAYPHLKIFLCSQTYRFWMDESGVFTEDSDTRVNSKGAKLTDFVAKTEEVAREYHLPFIDNYYGLGFNKFNRSAYFYETDGTHPMLAGCKRIAERMARKLY